MCEREQWGKGQSAIESEAQVAAFHPDANKFEFLHKWKLIVVVSRNTENS